MQRSLKSIINLIQEGTVNKDQVMCGYAREIVRLTENDNDLFLDTCQRMKDTISELTSKLSNSTTSDSEKRSHGLCFPVTGRNFNRVEKRKKTCGI